MKGSIIEVIIHNKLFGVNCCLNGEPDMILTYKECEDKYGSDYQIKKEIENGRLFLLEKGVYSLNKKCSEMEIVLAKYPRAIYTGESAYYYMGLTDVIPNEHVLATKRTDTRIKDKNVHQIFVTDEIFDLGRISMEYRGNEIPIYRRERLLVDLIRSRTKYPFDYYKEVIGNFRSIASTLDFFFIEEYAAKFRTKKAIMNAIQLEVL